MVNRLPLPPRWRKVWADLWGNKLRTLLVVMSVSVGVFAVGMLYSANLMFERDMGRSWGAAAPASGTLYADPFDEEIVESARRVRGVKEAEGRRNVDIRVQAPSGEWKQILLIAIPDYTKQKVNLIRSQAGAWPPGDGDVLLERTSLAELGVAQGGSITVETPSGRKRVMKVTGVVYDASQISSLFSGRSYGYINMDTLEKLDEPRRLDQVNFVVQPAIAQQSVAEDSTEPIKKIGKMVWTKLEQGNTIVFWLQANRVGEHPMQKGINAVMMLLAVLGVLSLLLGSFLLVNTVSAILTQQTRQIGIMKAIGARRDQMLKLYMSLVAAYGVLALVVAAPLGAVAASAITGFMAQVFNFDSGGFELPPRVLLLEAAVALVIPLLAALWPIWRGTGITVREAVSDYGISGVEAKTRIDRLVDKGLERMRRVSRPVVLSLRNTFRRKGRLALTLLTLTIAGTVFMAVFSVRASLDTTLDQALAYFRYDISIGFTEDFRASRVEQEAMKIPGVERAEAWGFTSGRLLKDARKESENEASKSVFVLAAPVDTKMIIPEIIDGRWLVPGDENAVVLNTEVLKDAKYIKVGSDAVIKIGNRKVTSRVVGIAKSVMTGPIAYAPYDWMQGAIQQAGRARSVQIVTTTADSKEQSALGRTLEAHMKKHNLKVSNVDITWEQKDRIRAQFNIITGFLLMMAVLLAVVGALGLTGTMGINVLERTREIGVMRAVGASSLSIAKVFVVEALCIGVISWLIGAVLALPVSMLLSYQVGMLFMESPLEFTYSMLGLAIWLALSVVLSVLASLLPAWNAARLSVRDILSYE